MYVKKIILINKCFEKKNDKDVSTTTVSFIIGYLCVTYFLFKMIIIT